MEVTGTFLPCRDRKPEAVLHPEECADICASVKDLKMQESCYVSYPHLIHLENVEKSSGFWKITVSFPKLKQVIKLITDSVLRVGSLCSTVPGLGAAVALADAFSSHQSAATASSCFLYLAGPAVPLYSVASGLCQFCRVQYIISPQRF